MRHTGSTVVCWGAALLAITSCARTQHSTVVCDAQTKGVTSTVQACLQARARFANLTGDLAPPGTIVITSGRDVYQGEVHDSTWTIVWPTDSLLALSAQRLNLGSHMLAGPAEMVHTLLPHEIGHRMIGAWLTGHKAAPDRRIGSPLPAWFQEGAAVWMESPHSRLFRYMKAKQFVATADVHRDLLREVQIAQHTDSETMLSGYKEIIERSPCVHPATCGWPHPTETQRITKYLMPDGALHADTTYASGPLPSTEDDSLYSLGYALMLYLHDHYGAAGIVRAGRALQAHPAANLRDIWPNDPALTDSAWRTWLKGRDSTLP